MNTHHTKRTNRHPSSNGAALTHEEVRPGMWYRLYEVGNSTTPAGMGVFLSEPHLNARDELIVATEDTKGNYREVDTAAIGLTPSTDGTTWGDRYVVQA